jgi:hypothetical protein
MQVMPMAVGLLAGLTGLTGFGGQILYGGKWARKYETSLF